MTIPGGGEAEDVGGAAGVAGVDDAAHDAVAGEEGISFVNEEGRLAGVNGAEEGADGDVGGDEGLAGHGGEDAQEGGFAAAFFRGLNGDISDGIAQFEGPGVQDPDGQRGGGVVAEDDVFFDDGFDVGEEAGDGDGQGVGSDGVEQDGFGFHNVFDSIMAGGVGQWLSKLAEKRIWGMEVQLIRICPEFP